MPFYRFATAVQPFLLLLQKKTLAKEKEPEGISISPQTPLNRPRKPLRFSWIFPAKADRFAPKTPSPGGRWPEGPDEGWGALSILLCKYSVHTAPHQSALARSQLPPGEAVWPVRIRTTLQVLMAVSIDCTNSKATDSKSEAILTGGAYHSARKVTACE